MHWNFDSFTWWGWGDACYLSPSGQGAVDREGGPPFPGSERTPAMLRIKSVRVLHALRVSVAHPGLLTV